MNQDLKEQFLNLKNGSHLMFIYQNKKEWMEVVINFITAAVEKNEKIIYVSGPYPDEELKTNLNNNDIEVEKLINKGQLSFLTQKDIYKDNFNAEDTVDFYRNETKKAVDEGYQALNVTGQINWVLKQKDYFKKIIEYEKKVDRKIFNKYPIKALCRYNRDRFEEQLIKYLIEIHPYIVWENKLYNNPYYISIDSVKENNLYQEEIDKWLENIKKYQNEKQSYKKELNQEKSMFEFIFNELDEAIFIRELYQDKIPKYEIVNKKACKLLNYTKAELLDKTPEDIINQSEIEKIPEKDKYKRLLDGEKLNFFLNLKTKEGKLIPCENHAQLLEYKGRSLVLIVTRDISESIRKETELKKRYQEIKEKNQELELLNQRMQQLVNIITELSSYSIENEKTFLKKIFRTAFNLISPAEAGSVYIFKEGKIKFVDTIGHNMKLLNQLEIDKNKYIYTKEVVKIADINENILSLLSSEEQKQYKKAIIPTKETIKFNITSSNKNIGGLSLDIKKGSENTFDQVSLKVFGAFKNIIEAFYKIQNYDKLKGQFTKELALAMINMLEYHDEYTIGHSENVALLATDFAEFLGLSEEIISRVYWAGLVHDIGKIAVPSEILNKKGKLTKKEYEVIKNHPVWAYETLKNSSQLADIAEFVLYHHERWDGNGYPEGIKGDKIPMISQILSLADSWDAMRSNRSYRDALSYRKAIKELEINRDKQHSAKLTNKFIEMIKSESDKLFSHK